jgi:ABC-type Fe3+/spermidine/putrescine transport system ATPase subunit
VVLEIASGVCVHGYEKGRHVGAEGAFSVRTVYPWLSREQPPSTVNTWQVRISHRVFLGDFVQYLVEWAGHQLVVQRPPTEHFDEGEQVYLGIAPEHCVLLEA